MTDRPVLYLDFDGVLNDSAWLASTERHDAITVRQHVSGKTRYEAMCSIAPLHDLRPEHAARVRRILDATGAALIVCSSWRRLMDDEALRVALARVGLPFDGATPRQSHKMSVHDTRERDILAHVATLPAGTRWCVLDDDVRAVLGELDRFFGHVVTPDDGVTDADVDAVIAILTGAP